MRTKIHETYEITDLKDMLEKSGKLYGQKNAVKQKSKKEGQFEYITHSQMREKINALGTSLLDLDLKGKKIGVIGENRYEWAISYLATTTGVGIIVPLDKALPENEILDLIKRSQIEGIIYSQKYHDILYKALKSDDNNLKILINMDSKKSEDIKEKTIIKEAAKTINKKEVYTVFSFNELIEKGQKKIKKGDDRFEKIKIDPEQTASILFTSGTTSKSKAVELTHKNLVSNLMDIASVLDVNSNDTFLSFLPLHHTFECTTEMLYSMYSGSCVAYCTSLKTFAKDIKDYEVTCFVAVPILVEGIYKKLNKAIKKQGKEEKVKTGIKLSNILLKLGLDVRKKIFKEIHEQLGTSLRLIVVGGAAYDKEVQESLNAIGIKTLQGYGLTETSPVVATEDDKYQKNGTIGKALPSLDVKLDNVDEQGIGELLVKRPSVMKGYYQNDEANKKVFTSDGYFRTGDLASIDKDGFITITGRVKYVIVLRNGKNIYPEEIETYINKIPGVAESMVYGIPDKDKEYILGAKVVYDEIEINEILNDNFNEQDKNTYLPEDEIYNYIHNQIKLINHKMPTYKYVKDLIVTKDEFEKTTTQKIKRNIEEAKILNK